MDSVAFKMNFVIDLRHTRICLVACRNRAKQLGSIQPTACSWIRVNSNRGRKDTVFISESLKAVDCRLFWFTLEYMAFQSVECFLKQIPLFKERSLHSYPSRHARLRPIVIYFYMHNRYTLLKWLFFTHSSE